MNSYWRNCDMTYHELEVVLAMASLQAKHLLSILRTFNAYVFSHRGYLINVLVSKYIKC
jgi:hypothetical protein